MQKAKKIIKSIMGKDAKERGYACRHDKPCFSKCTVASFNKYVDECCVGYDIDIDPISMTDVTLQVRQEKYSKTFTDEESFKQAIAEFEEIMVNKGFDELEKVILKPRFKSADNQYFYTIYNNLCEVYHRQHKITNDVKIADRIHMIIESIEDSKGKDFADVKEDLIMVAAFYSETLLLVENTRMVLEDDSFVIIYKGDRIQTQPLGDIISSWCGEHGYSLINGVCEDFLTEEEFNKIVWN